MLDGFFEIRIVMFHALELWYKKLKSIYLNLLNSVTSIKDNESNPKFCGETLLTLMDSLFRMTVQLREKFVK